MTLGFEVVLVLDESVDISGPADERADDLVTDGDERLLVDEDGEMFGDNERLFEDDKGLLEDAEDRLGEAEKLLEVDEEVLVGDDNEPLVEDDERLLVVEIDVKDVVVVGTRMPAQALGLLLAARS
jgi:hypothetical protein